MHQQGAPLPPPAATPAAMPPPAPLRALPPPVASAMPTVPPTVPPAPAAPAPPPAPLSTSSTARTSRRPPVAVIVAALLFVAGVAFGVYDQYRDLSETADTNELPEFIQEGIDSGEFQLRAPGETFPPVTVAELTVESVEPVEPVDDQRNLRDRNREWLGWATAEPWETNPVADTTGEFCALNQPDDSVWFLAGSFGETLTRSCTIPADRAVLVPAINTWCDPFDIVQCESINDADVSIELDGEQLQVFGSFTGRVHFDAAPGNPIAPEGPNVLAINGLWALIEFDGPGTHTLHITATSADGGFAVDVTYDLTIV